jgi:hypothetical protein
MRALHRVCDQCAKLAFADIWAGEDARRQVDTR